MTPEQREQIVEALYCAIGGLRINGQEAFDPDRQRLQIGKFVDLLVDALSPSRGMSSMSLLRWWKNWD